MPVVPSFEYSGDLRVVGGNHFEAVQHDDDDGPDDQLERRLLECKLSHKLTSTLDLLRSFIDNEKLYTTKR